jgi:hypothetical protein
MTKSVVILAALGCLVGLFEVDHDSYYALLRWLVVGACGVIIFHIERTQMISAVKILLTMIYLLIAALFNPIYPFDTDAVYEVGWALVNLGAFGFMLGGLYFLTASTQKSVATKDSTNPPGPNDWFSSVGSETQVLAGNNPSTVSPMEHKPISIPMRCLYTFGGFVGGLLLSWIVGALMYSVGLESVARAAFTAAFLAAIGSAVWTWKATGASQPIDDSAP